MYYKITRSNTQTNLGLVVSLSIVKSETRSSLSTQIKIEISKVACKRIKAIEDPFEYSDKALDPLAGSGVD